jgi:hypothetical protein
VRGACRREYSLSVATSAATSPPTAAPATTRTTRTITATIHALTRLTAFGTLRCVGRLTTLACAGTDGLPRLALAAIFTLATRLRPIPNTTFGALGFGL